MNSLSFQVDLEHKDFLDLVGKMYNFLDENYMYSAPSIGQISITAIKNNSPTEITNIDSNSVEELPVEELPVEELPVESQDLSSLNALEREETMMVKNILFSVCENVVVSDQIESEAILYHVYPINEYSDTNILGLLYKGSHCIFEVTSNEKEIVLYFQDENLKTRSFKTVLCQSDKDFIILNKNKVNISNDKISTQQYSF